MDVEAIAPAQAVPDHIPTELVWDNNLPAFVCEMDDPYIAAARLHDGPPVIWSTNALFGRPGWVVTRLEPMQQAYIDYETFTASRGQTTGPNGASWRLNPLQFDPPEHHGYRNILNPFFTPRSVNAMEASMRATGDALIAKFEDKGGCEFISDFAIQFPSSIFLDLMGMPHAMLPQFLAWEHHLMRGTMAERAAATDEVVAYLTKFLAEQRQHPASPLMAGLTTATLGDRPLDDGEILGMMFLLYIGGLDTVYSALGWIFRHLTLDQALQATLRAQPDRIPAAVDEFLRAYAVAAPHRGVTRDIDFHGAPMKQGDIVLLPTYLAARDPAAYDNPHVVDIDRKARHITFGTGTHNCLGVNVAKREVRIVLEAFLSRFANIRIPEGETYAFHSGSVLGVDRLPLVWDRVA